MQTEDEVFADIKSLKIQGATNVALSLLTQLTETIDTNPTMPVLTVKTIGQRLAFARPTEPLAQNAVRFLFADNPNDLQTLKTKIAAYQTFIAEAKKSISAKSAGILTDGKTYLTHCHSSTVTNMFLDAHMAGKTVRVIATETRPRMQGRLTVRELLDGGIKDVTMIVDSAAASVLADRGRNIAGVIIGADLLTEHGFVNKIGSLSVVLAAREQKIPVYCLSTLLKYDPRPFNENLIETRDPGEIWTEAPSNLTIYAPAFDFTPYELGVSVITEVGEIPGDKVKETALGQYPFIRE